MKRTLRVAGSRRGWGLAVGGLVLVVAFLNRPVAGPQVPSSHDIGGMKPAPVGEIAGSERVTYYDPSTYSVGKDDG